MASEQIFFPFPALVGQEQVKLALMLLAVDHRLNGVLIRGEKGTAKSTAARGLAQLLPPVRVNEGCRFGCPADRPESWCGECRKIGEGAGAPATVERKPAFETLPLGVTEDQLLGTIDIEHALKTGEKKFEPGILARVNSGVLYVDEVNLLDDHIVDLLLDCAATGVNIVAREGVSITHPAEFLLVGTMNPEEGDLRPQLLDRFGLCVEMRGIEDPEIRAEIVERCLAFEAAPREFGREWAGEAEALSDRISRAREIIASIRPDKRWRVAAAKLSLSIGVHGHRADTLMIKSARAMAALDGRGEINAADFEAAATLVYPHRIRRSPFEEKTITGEELRRLARETIEASEKTEPAEKKKIKAISATEVSEIERPESPPMGHNRYAHSDEVARSAAPENRKSAGRNETGFVIKGLFDAGLWSSDPADGENLSELGIEALKPDENRLPASRGESRLDSRGTRMTESPKSFRGRYIGAVAGGGALRDPAWDAAIRATAHLQPARSRGNLAIEIRPDELPRKKRAHRPGRLALFVVDVSGSMGGELMALAKRAALDMLKDAYVMRRRVGMIAFRAAGAELIFAPTTQAELVHRAIRALPCGGTTPLASALKLAEQTLRREKLRDPGQTATLVLISDGRANVGSRPGQEAVHKEVETLAAALARRPGLKILFLDATEAGKSRFHADRLAALLGAERVRLSRVARGGKNPSEEVTRMMRKL